MARLVSKLFRKNIPEKQKNNSRTNYWKKDIFKPGQLMYGWPKISLIPPTTKIRVEKHFHLIIGTDKKSCYVKPIDTSSNIFCFSLIYMSVRQI